MTQINPPFDGSPPCPMCSEEVRSISALMHNFLVRWPETQAFVKLNDIRRFWVRPEAIEVENPLVAKLFDLADELKAACSLMKEEGGMIRWEPETYAQVAEIVPRAEANQFELDALSEAHWADRRHSHGHENILREEHGITAIKVVPDGGDLRHEACGTRLRLHQHFKDNLARDPGFYGSVWCPTCSQNLPFAQFKAD